MLYDLRSFARFADLAILKASGTHYPLTLQRAGDILLFYTTYFTLEAAAWPGLLADDLFIREYRNEEVREPVFIVGNPRSGTTFLHRLLAKDEATFTTMRLRDILVAPSVWNRRLFRTLAQIDRALGRPASRLAGFLAERAQLGNVMHRTALNEPEEDQVLLWHIWSTIMVWEQSAITQGARPFVYFDEEMPDADKQRIMRFYVDCVKRHLHANHNGCEASVHYLSKSPAFSGRIDSLRRTFPDARFVYLVRNPLHVIPSYISLLSYAWPYFGVTGGEHELREFVMDTVSHWYRHPLERLADAPAGAAAIVRYEDVRQDAESVVRDLYSQFGFTMREPFAGTLAREAERARAYRSHHRYSLSRFGLSRDAIVAEFSDIFHRFGFSTEAEPA